MLTRQESMGLSRASSDESDFARMLSLQRAMLSLVMEVHEAYDVLVKHGNGDTSNLTKAIGELEKKIFEVDEERSFHYATAISSESLFPNGVVTTTRKIYEVWETRVENEYSERVLGRSPNLRRPWAGELCEYLLYRRFRKLVGGELSLLVKNVPGLKLQRIGFVGSGPFPVSALLLYELTKAHIVSYDRDPVAIERQRSLLRYLEVEDAFSQVCTCGEEADFSSVDVVVIALLARPKDAILRQILETNPRVPVLCRTSFGVRQLLYEPYQNALNLPEPLCVQGIRVAEPDETISTILLQAGSPHGT